MTPTPTPPEADAAPPAPTGTLSLHVIDNDLFVYGKTPPLANANVAFFPPGGGALMETTSDADGLAKFSGIDWSLGKGTLLAYAPSRGATIFTDVDEDAIARAAVKSPSTSIEGLLIGLSTRASAMPKAMVTGMLTKADPAHYVTLGTSVSDGFFQDSTATYAISVPPGKGFSIVATEWKIETAPAIQSFFKWIQIDVAAGTATVNVDFATAKALTSAKVKRTFNVPGGASGALGGTNGYLQTTLVSTRAPLGFATSQQASSDGASVAIEAEVIPDFPGSIVTFNTLGKTDGSFSYVIEDGAPKDGTTVDGFLAPPAFTFDGVHLGDPLAVTGVASSVSCYAQYVDSIGDILMNIAPATAPGDAGFTMTPPRKATLPMALQTQLGTQALAANFVCRSGDDDTNPISKVAKHYLYSRVFSSAF